MKFGVAMTCPYTCASTADSVASDTETVRVELMDGDGKLKENEKVENLLKRCVFLVQTARLPGSPADFPNTPLLPYLGVVRPVY